MILTNSSMTRSTRSLRNGISYKAHQANKINKLSTDFIGKTFVGTEKMRERKEIRKLGAYNQFTKKIQNAKNKIQNNIYNYKANNVNQLFVNDKNGHAVVAAIKAAQCTNIDTLQTKKCDNICADNKLKSLKSLQLQIERDEISKNEENKFEKNRQKYIAAMVKEMFDKIGNKNEKEFKETNKTMIGRDKFIIKTKIRKDSINIWRVNMNDINIKNMIFGVQIMDKNGARNTIYSNEKGMIFFDKKYAQKGVKIKNKSQIVISIKYTNYGEIMVHFSYFKHGKLIKRNCKPIVIEELTGFKYGVNAKIFVAQNNGYGKYQIIHQIAN